MDRVPRPHVRLDSDERADADTQYKIGSISKTMTAVLVMLARERGELSLSDPAGRFVPQGPFADATLRSLLAHASGISAEPLGSWWERSPGVDAAALAAAHEGAERVFETGSRFHYSNLGYGVLGRSSRRSPVPPGTTSLREQVLAPLGHDRTTYQLGGGGTPRASPSHHLTGELTVEPLPDTGAMAPAGQLWSTVRDLATLADCLVDRRARLLAPSRWPRCARRSRRPRRTVGGTGWGCGCCRRGRAPLVGHTGSMPGFQAGSVDPASRIGAVVLTNATTTGSTPSSRAVHTLLERRADRPADEWAPNATPPRSCAGSSGSGTGATPPLRCVVATARAGARPRPLAGRWPSASSTATPTSASAATTPARRCASSAPRTARSRTSRCATFVYTRDAVRPGRPDPRRPASADSALVDGRNPPADPA